ncbi:MAG: co-chaperone GroES [Cyclobacteriaceae bacterium]|jgi:chaperonin GroES
MRELQPVNQNVILDVSEEVSEQKTAGGIIIPDTAAVEKPKFAKVVALSNIEGPEIAVGDVVFYKEYSGTEIELDDGKFLVVPYADVLAKLVETEEI